MIKAIIFDCFGVLTSDELLPFLDEFFGSDPVRLGQARAICHQVSAGLEFHGTMIRRLAELAGISEQAARARIEHNVPNDALLTYIATELKPHYKIGFLSNCGKNWLPEIFRPEQIELFDAIVLSHEVGYTKPEPQAYEITADLMKVRLEECIMIDDREAYCEGARTVGMQAVLYTSTAQTRDELSQLLGGTR